MRKKLLTHVLLDVGVIALSLYLSFWLRVGAEVHGIYQPIFLKFLLVYIITRPLIFYFMGVYRIIWRYVTADDAARLMRAVVASSGAVLAITFLIELEQLSRTVFLIEMPIVTIALLGVRLMRRLAFERSSRRLVRQQGQATLIFGAGHAGRTIAKRLQTDQGMRSHLIGYVDDDPDKIGRSIDGVKVLGGIEELAELIQTHAIKQVIIAIRDPSGDLLKNLIQICKPFNIRPQLIANRQNRNADVVREIELKDLLNRPQRHIDLGGIKALIEGKRVLVTGAGGSIGAELSRQIYSFAPSQLLLLDHSEYNLYQIDQELRLNSQDTQSITPLMVDIKDEALMRNAFKRFKPEIVFHAAAYKHVHLVEANPYSTILNNVLGTQILLDLCEEYGVETTVLISSDKAVNPAGVMGSTKRLCELLIAAKGLRTKRRFCAVRFGNVLGSSGSLIPMLLQQVSEGRPITITHENMTRYFMLIPEAVSLVLNAAILSAPGDLQVLKMGEPIRILDIAKSLLALTGRTEEDHPIQFIGLRPGEKMFEELYISGKELQTKHPDILTVPGGDNLPSYEDPLALAQIIESKIDTIISLAQDENQNSIFLMNEIVHSPQKIVQPSSLGALGIPPKRDV